MASLGSVWSIGVSNLPPSSTPLPPSLTPKQGKRCRWVLRAVLIDASDNINKGIKSQTNISGITMRTSPTSGNYERQSKSKRVWVWTESKQVMTAAVERGWNTFIFASSNRALASDWSSCAAIALIYPLFLEDGEILDCENRKVATFFRDCFTSTITRAPFSG
ncbi:uncharacterized protein LOC122081937 [Macadamia integrifolia]|uniref:uncharacterized protein LOC122081937 n=1 Tax=Macadamia integrifolia TaxID=60698 RepID=UPI001C4E8F39|nr:uncharacterized protein LOC122081937 [Macadamia integrifolia]